MIDRKILDYLSDLKANNNREWFNARKDTFKAHEKEVKRFFQEIENELQKTDNLEGHKVWRIYRDIRFSKDKTPFKARFSGGYKRATAALRGGYFLNIEPGNSAVGGGFYGPSSEDLKRIRQEFEMDDSEIRKIINNKNFKHTFGEMRGEGVKSAPRGFKADHPAIDLIKKKQFYFYKSFSDKEVCKAGFKDQVIETFLTIRPFFDYMSEVLTTDLNGESMLD